MPAFVDQVKRGPITVFIGGPCRAVIILRHRIGHVQVDDGCFQVVQVTFVVKFGIMIADHDQTFVFVQIMPFPQRGNYPLAVYSAKGPHIEQDDLTAQVGQSQRGIGVEPDIIYQLGGFTQVREG